MFVGEYYSHEDEPDAEGNISLWRSTAGVEYHDSAVKLNLAPTFNKYNANDRVGAAGDVTWTINDRWAIGGGGQLFFSIDTPLRALNAGVTANSYNANLQWHQNDARSLRVDINAMTFSDQNLRVSESGLYSERFYTGSKFTLDGVVSAVESQDSLDEDRSYFNPKADLLALAGLRATQELYRDGDTVYLQSLQVTPGDYWQRNYGENLALDARYELRAHFNDKFEVGLGGDFSHQAADETPQNTVTVLFDLTQRF